MIDGNRLGAVGLEKLGTPYGQMDCQAFIEWCLAQCGLRKDLAGSNAWYREVMKNGWAGSPEECVKKFGKGPAGAFLFIHAFDGGEPAKYRPDGLGNASHIGIVTGKGEGAVHSSSSRGCVAESRFKGKSISGGHFPCFLGVNYIIRRAGNLLGVSGGTISTKRFYSSH